MPQFSSDHPTPPAAPVDSEVPAAAAPTEPVQPQRAPFPTVRRVPFLSAFRWLQAGGRVWLARPAASLFYGVCFAVMGWTLGALLRDSPTLMMALTCGFLLVGPILAMGVYDIARRHDRGEPAGIADTAFAWTTNASNLAILAVALGVLMMLWARTSMMLIAIFFPHRMPNVRMLLEQLSSGASVPFLTAYVLAGAVFAAIVFAFSAVAIPLMLDRRTDAITAILASVVAVGRNLPAMLLWAALLVVLTVVGFLTAFVGLIVTVPWLGLATWYAYQDLVEPAAPAD